MIPLQDYIDALMWGNDDYVQLTCYQTRLIEEHADDNFHKHYLLENNNDTLYPRSHIILPYLHPSEKRLWYREKWEEFNGEEAKSEHKKWKIMQMLKVELNK